MYKVWTDEMVVEHFKTINYRDLSYKVHEVSALSGRKRKDVLNVLVQYKLI